MIRLFQVAHDQRRAILFGVLALTLVGYVLGLRLPAAILPEVTFPRITVIADSGERSGDEMLREVTRPIEGSIRRVPGLVEMRSTTSRGSTEINLDFGWSDDMGLTLQRVQAQIAAVRDQLPAGTSIEARLMNPTMFPVLGYSLVSPTHSLAELRDIAVMQIQPELSRLPGVAEVVIQGGRQLEARVTLDAAALEAHGLDAKQVADRLTNVSTLESVGLLEANRELYLGLADARPLNLDTLANVPIPIPDGTPVPLRALGRISLEEEPQFTRYAAQSREAVLVSVLRQPSSSTIGVAQEARRWFDQHRSVLPPDVQEQVFYDQSDLVRQSITSVRDSLVVGALLAVIIIIVFLGSLRLGWSALVVLPASVGLTLLGASLAHQSLNLMTLGGIAAAVGLVLDDAIVVVEHLSQRAKTVGSDPASVAAGMAEIVPSLLGSSLCTIAIFIPFMFLGGVTGAFFRVLAFAMTMMLTASLLLCCTVVPVIARPTPHHERRMPRVRERFSRAIEWAAGRRWMVLVPVLLAVLIVPLRSTLGSGFLPEMDEGSMILDYVLPPGTSLTESDRILRQVEKIIDTIPDIAAWSRRTGDQLGFFITEPNSGDYVLRLKPGKRRSADEVADDLRARIEASQPAMSIEFGQLVEDVIGDLTTNPQPVEIRILGEDRALLHQKAIETAAMLERVRGVVDVHSGVVVSGPNLSIVPNEGAARAGLSTQDLADAVSPAIAGIPAGQIVRGARAWPMRVVLPRPVGPPGPGALAELRVPLAPRRWSRLGDVATVRIQAGETEIARDNQRTMISVTARLTNRDLGSAMREIQGRMAREIVLPPGMAVRYGGTWAEQQSSFAGLTSVLVGALVAVLLILLASFRSWRVTGAVILVVIASLVGVFVALHLAQVTFNISSFVGAIMVVGIVAENAYFLVAAKLAFQAEGSSSFAAAIGAARRRARPVLMTTAAGVAALLPLALGLSPGGALLRPLAVAVVGGFFTSAPLLLFALPSIIARWE